MTPIATLGLTAAIAVFICGIMVGIFFVSNLAHASYSFCNTVNNRPICITSPDIVCTYYSTNSVSCNSRNFTNSTLNEAMPDIPDIPDY